MKTNRLFYSLMVLPFLGIPALILFRKRKEAEDADVVGNKKRKTRKHNNDTQKTPEKKHDKKCEQHKQQKNEYTKTQKHIA